MTKNPKNNTKDFIWNALGLTFNAFNSLFFLVAVKLINGIDDAGIFTYAFALCTLFYVLATYFNRPYQVSEYRHRFSFNDYLTCRIVLSAISFVAIFILSTISGFDTYKTIVIILLLVFRIVESISDCFYGAIQKQNKLYQTGISLTLKALLGLTIFTITDIITQNLLIAIIALILVNIFFLIIYDLPNFRKLYTEKIKLTTQKTRKILKICFPIFLFSALSIYLSNCQKYILTYFEPNDIQTIFGILIMPATIISLIGAYLVNPSINLLSDLHIQKNYNSFSKVTQKIFTIIISSGIAIFVIAFLIGIPILNFVFQIDLNSYKTLFLIAMLAAIFYAICLIMSSILTILEKNKQQSIFYIITAIISTIISIFAIVNFGIAGAIFSFLISSIILLAFYITAYYLCIKKLKKEHQK